MKRVLLIGGAGQLGQAIYRAFSSWNVFAPDHKTLDIADEENSIKTIKEMDIDIVINTAAFHDVPRCEKEALQAFKVNTLGARNLAKACSEKDVPFLHISTDYVFDGKKEAPYLEDDRANPLNIYGDTKLSGERQAQLHCPQSWIVRTTGLFGKDNCRAKPGGRNFIDLMTHLSSVKEYLEVVDDVKCCPTFVEDLACQIKTIIENKAPYGIYHGVSDQGASWYEFAKMIFSQKHIEIDIRPVGAEHFADPVKRPADSRLSTKKLKDMGLYIMRPLDEALNAYIDLT